MARGEMQVRRTPPVSPPSSTQKEWHCFKRDSFQEVILEAAKNKNVFMSAPKSQLYKRESSAALSELKQTLRSRCKSERLLICMPFVKSLNQPSSKNEKSEDWSEERGLKMMRQALKIHSMNVCLKDNYLIVIQEENSCVSNSSDGDEENNNLVVVVNSAQD